MNKLNTERRTLALKLLLDGMSMRAIMRTTDISYNAPDLTPPSRSATLSVAVNDEWNATPIRGRGRAIKPRDCHARDRGFESRRPRQPQPRKRGNRMSRKTKHARGRPPGRRAVREDERTRVMASIRIEVLNQLDRYAEDQGLTRSAATATCLEERFKEHAPASGARQR